MIATAIVATAVVEAGKLGEVVLYALLATVGVAILVSLAILGSTRFLERDREGASAALAYGALAVLSLLSSLAVVVYGVVLLSSK